MLNVMVGNNKESVQELIPPIHLLISFLVMRLYETGAVKDQQKGGGGLEYHYIKLAP